MSSPVGSYSGFIDTQDVKVENVTDALIYTQVLSALPIEMDHDMEVNHTATGYVEKLETLTNAAWELLLALTEPEALALGTLCIPIANKLPIKQWKITLTSYSGNATTMTGFAKMRSWKILDQGIGGVRASFRLEFQSDIVGKVAKVITLT